MDEENAIVKGIKVTICLILAILAIPILAVMFVLEEGFAWFERKMDAFLDEKIAKRLLD